MFNELEARIKEVKDSLATAVTAEKAAIEEYRNKGGPELLKAAVKANREKIKAAEVAKKTLGELLFKTAIFIGDLMRLQLAIKSQREEINNITNSQPEASLIELLEKSESTIVEHKKQTIESEETV